MKITTKLHLIFFIIMMLIGIVALFAMFQIHTLFKLSTHLENHTLVVKSNAVYEININVIQMVNRLKEMTSLLNQTDLESTIQIITSYEENIEQNFDIIENKFIGDKSYFDKVTRLFEEWKSIRNEIIALYKSGKIIEANHLIVKGRGVEQVQRLETALEQLHQFMDAKAERYLGKTDVATKQVFQISIAIVILIFLSEWLIFLVSRLIIHDMGVIIEMLNNSDKQTNAENQTEISPPDVNHQTKISQKIVDLIQIELNDSLQKLDKMEVKLQELQAKNQKLQEEKWKLQEEKSVIETLSIDDSGLEKEKSPQAPLYKREESTASLPLLGIEKEVVKKDLLIPSPLDNKNQTVTNLSKGEKDHSEPEKPSTQTILPINQNKMKVLEPAQLEISLKEKNIAETILSTLKTSETDIFTDLFAEDDIYYDFKNSK